MIDDGTAGANTCDKVILAIDLGTSGPKVALVSTSGAVLASAWEDTPLLFLPNGGAEQRPDDWWNAIVRASKAVLDQNVVAASAIVAVCCASQYSCTVAVDRDGKPLMNAINWMDTRGARAVREAIGGTPSFNGYGLAKIAKFIRLTGGAPAPSGKDSIAHILWLKRECPELYRAAHKFLEPKDYLNHRMTGKFAASFDSIGLHWITDNRRIDKVTYDDGLMKILGVEHDKFPDLMHASERVGELLPGPAAELGVPAGIPVFCGTADTQSSAIGSGAVRDYDGYLYLGTSSWISCFVPFKKTDIIHNIASLPSAVPGRYWVANEQECAGACLAWLRDKAVYPDDAVSLGPRPDDAYRRFDTLAATAPPGSDKLIFLPWMYGERTPIEDHSVRGGFVNLTLNTQRSHMIRAVMEGVAYNSRWLLQTVERFCGRPFKGLNMIGGGAKSDLWCQILADVLDRPIRRVRDPLSANARGAGLIASVGLGLTKFDDIAMHVEIEQTFEPNPANRAIYDELFKEFLSIYQKNKGIFGRLNPHA